MKTMTLIVMVVFMLAAIISSLTVLGRSNLLYVRKYMDAYNRRYNRSHSINASSWNVTSGNYSLIPKTNCPEHTHILVAAISHINNHIIRNTIRNCWRGENRPANCYWTMCPHNRVCDFSRFRLVFVTGRSSNLTVQKSLEEEHSEFDDIIQGTFNDTYRTLVHKSILLLDYTVNYCKSAEFVQKIDDDVYLNISAIDHILRQHPDTPEGYVIGRKISGYPVVREGKHKLSKTEFKPDKYPDYLMGLSYIISKNATTALLNVAVKEPLVHVEDVFMGICIKKTNIKIIDTTSRFCLIKGQKNCAVNHHR